jgi:hypothetical protein
MSRLMGSLLALQERREADAASIMAGTMFAREPDGLTHMTPTRSNVLPSGIRGTCSRDKPCGRCEPGSGRSRSWTPGFGVIRGGASRARANEYGFARNESEAKPELLKPGFGGGETSVSKYAIRRRTPASRTWRIFPGAM